MKNKFSKFRFVVLSVVLFLFISDLMSQDVIQQDSFIRLTKSKTFLTSNPAPQYIVEIKNDKTIRFYNTLPENFAEYKSEIIGSWMIDSATMFLENLDFIELSNIIKAIDLENIDKIEKPKTENGIEIHYAGGVYDKYIIELINKKVEFFIDSNNENYISESAKMVRDLIKELEEKYKPVE